MFDKHLKRHNYMKAIIQQQNWLSFTKLYEARWLKGDWQFRTGWFLSTFATSIQKYVTEKHCKWVGLILKAIDRCVDSTRSETPTEASHSSVWIETCNTRIYRSKLLTPQLTYMCTWLVINLCMCTWLVIYVIMHVYMTCYQHMHDLLLI